MKEIGEITKLWLKLFNINAHQYLYIHKLYFSADTLGKYNKGNYFHLHQCISKLKSCSSHCFCIFREEGCKENQVSFHFVV